MVGRYNVIVSKETGKPTQIVDNDTDKITNLKPSPSRKTEEEEED